MSKADQDALQRWKDKYFEQLETFEEKEKSAQALRSTLERLVVRISLAADQSSEALDVELAELRDQLRQEGEHPKELEKRLTKIDKLVRQFGESRDRNVARCIEILTALIDQLQSIDTASAHKPDLKALRKRVKQDGERFSAYGGILEELHQIQTHLLSQSAPEKDKGFLGRLFGGASGEQDKHSNNDLASSSTEELHNLEHGDEGLSHAMEIPAYSNIAKHIRATFEQLLEQLEFPDSVHDDVDELKERVAGPLNWYELAPLLDDLSNLLVAVVGRGQKEFEQFLLSLDERLEKVQAFLSIEHEHDQKRLEKSSKMDKALRARVSEMSKEITDANDIEQLKRSIDAHLDQITDTMDQFVSDEERVAKDKDQQVRELQGRLRAMEQQTNQIRQRLREERSKALTDVLTGLPNREAYEERIELEYERWRRYGTPVSLVVADIDLFKQVNDQYGHLAGDKVLQIMAKEIKTRIRSTDFVARYGGEEFVILLPETPIETAQIVIDKTREMIARLPFHFKEEPVQITMSFGLVGFEGDASYTQFFAMADDALYEAKKKGRNRVEVSQ